MIKKLLNKLYKALLVSRDDSHELLMASMEADIIICEDLTVNRIDHAQIAYVSENRHVFEISAETIFIYELKSNVNINNTQFDPLWLDNNAHLLFTLPIENAHIRDEHSTAYYENVGRVKNAIIASYELHLNTMYQFDAMDMLNEPF